MLGLWWSRFFSSVKALAGDVVYSHCLEGFATETAIWFLVYNVAVIIKLNISTSRL